MLPFFERKLRMPTERELGLGLTDHIIQITNGVPAVHLPNYVLDLAKIPTDDYKESMAKICEPVRKDTLRRLLFYISKTEPDSEPVKQQVAFMERFYRATNDLQGTMMMSFQQRLEMGRFYADNFEDHHISGSLLNLNKKYRGTIFRRDGIVDIDMVKSHPSLIRAYANLCKMKVPTISEYIDHSERYLGELAEHWGLPGQPLPTSYIKQLINRTLYGGSIQAWFKDVKNGTIEKSKEPVPRIIRNEHSIPAFYGLLVREFEEVWKLIVDNHPKLMSAVALTATAPTDDGMGDEKRQERRCLSWFFGILENHILHIVLEHCRKREFIPKDANGRAIVVWGYDGLSWKLPNGMTVDEVLESINGVVAHKCGPAFAGVRFIEKTSDQFVQQVLDDDHEWWHSAEYITFTKHLRSRRRYTPLNSYILNRDTENMKKRSYLEMKALHEMTWFKLTTLEGGFGYQERDERGYLKKICIAKTMEKTYSHIQYLSQEVNKKGEVEEKMKPFWQTWEQDRSVLRYSIIDSFPPPLATPPGVFNKWIESPYHDRALEPGEEEHPTALADFKALVAAMCNNAESQFVFETWLAHAIQFPAEKPQITPFFFGTEGVGKGTLTSIIVAMFGKDRAVETTMEAAFGKFNEVIYNAYLAVVDELRSFTPESPEASAYKRAVTETTITVNIKNVAQFVQSSYHRFIFTSNDPVIFPGERRSFYMCVSAELKASNRAIFNRLHTYARCDDALASIYRHYQMFPVDRSVVMQMPKNDISVQMRSLVDMPGINHFVHWLLFFKMKDEMSENYKMANEDLAFLFQEWLESRAVKDAKCSTSVVARQMYSIGFWDNAVGPQLSDGIGASYHFWNFVKMRLQIVGIM